MIEIRRVPFLAEISDSNKPQEIKRSPTFIFSDNDDF